MSHTWVVGSFSPHQEVAGGPKRSLYDGVSRLGRTGVKGHSAGNHGAHMLNVTQRVAIAVARAALFTFLE